MTRAFACINDDLSVRRKSSSGGIFHALGLETINKGGVVFGARFDEKFQVIHDHAENSNELEFFLRSKYVQSRIGNSYIYVKQFLSQDRFVLFSGTPCQIGGLIKYLGENLANSPQLLLVDIVCHGVPSPLIWEKYLDQLSGDKKVVGVNFREKTPGWRLFSLRVDFSDSSFYVKPLTKDAYMQAFLRNLSLRPSCYACHFKGTKRESDITLADFWHVEEVLPRIDDDLGTSLVLTHSDKGFKTLKGLSSISIIDEIVPEMALAFNSAAINSVKKPIRRAEVFKAIKTHGQIEFDLVQLLSKHTKRSLFSRIRARLSRILG
jgi:coenzyme F420-reducing hydrogenase beta subunit